MPRRRYLAVAATLPTIYLVTYALLRLSGTYHPFFDQGSWDIDGTTHVYPLDLAFAPAAIIEADVQNRLRWLQEPTGG